MARPKKEKPEPLKKKSFEVKPIAVDVGAALKKIEKKQESIIYKCTCCGAEFKTQKGNFPPTNSMLYAANDGYLPFCRSCVEKYYFQLVGFYSGAEEHALEHCCRIFDWFYCDDAFEMSSKTAAGTNTTRISAYPGRAGMVQISRRGTTYLDTIKERNMVQSMSRETNSTDMTDTSMDNFSGGKKADIEDVQFFGAGHKPEEYEYLRTQYDDWTARYECKTKAQEEIFKALSISQLNMQRAARAGSGTRQMADATKTFKDLLTTANITPSQVNSDGLADQNTFGTLIKKWENERPIAKPDEEWTDVDGIKREIDTWFLGHLCNLVDIKNDNEALYRRELKKYTVTPPVYEQEDENSETSLLDKYSTKNSKKDLVPSE